MDQEFAVSDHSSLLRDPIRSGAEYVESLRGRNLTVYLMGDPVAEPVDHPIIRPSINAVAETYDLANNNPELASAMSPVTGERINRFGTVRISVCVRAIERYAAMALMKRSPKMTAN